MSLAYILFKDYANHDTSCYCIERSMSATANSREPNLHQGERLLKPDSKHHYPSEHPELNLHRRRHRWIELGGQSRHQCQRHTIRTWTNRLLYRLEWQTSSSPYPCEETARKWLSRLANATSVPRGWPY